MLSRIARGRVVAHLGLGRAAATTAASRRAPLPSPCQSQSVFSVSITHFESRSRHAVVFARRYSEAPGSLLAGAEAMATDEALVAALVATAAELPSVTSLNPIVSWGSNADPRGLEAFSRDSPRQTAKNWRDLFFQGSAGNVPLLARLRQPSTTFICASRLGALIELAPRLAQLDAGMLRGQKNCFVVIGSRQTGKSEFLRSLTLAVARAASRKTVAICVNYTDNGIREPLHLLQDALKVCPGVTLPPELAEPTASFTGLLDFMIGRNLRALLCIDDIEALYRCPRDSLLAERAFLQLKLLGRHNGPQRPAIVVLTGSAAVLRVLLFALDTPDYDGILRSYPCHLRFGSLNDNKFVPLLLAPVVSNVDLANAALCILASLPLDRERLVVDGCLVAPTAEAAPLLPMASTSVVPLPSPETFCSIIASGFTLTPPFVSWLALRCRGLAGWIVDAVRGQMTREHHLNRLIGTGSNATTRRAQLDRLLSAWMAAVKSTGRDVVTVAANTSDKSICDFGMPIDDAEPAGSWYDLADAGVLRFDGDCRPRMAGFLHPSDAGTLLIALHGLAPSARAGDELTPAEMLSLLAPQLASADEVNERLVLEGLSFTSHQPSALQVRGRGCIGTFRGIAHSAEHLTVLGTDADRLPTIDGLLPTARRNTLYKEFPDEQGSDGIALMNGDAQTAVRDSSCGPETAAAASAPTPVAVVRAEPTTIVHTLWRVQVKMSSQLGATDVTAPMVQNWMQKMSASSFLFLQLLAAKLPGAVVAVHVLWCAQRLTGPARRFLGGLPQQTAERLAARNLGTEAAAPHAGQKRRTQDEGVGAIETPVSPMPHPSCDGEPSSGAGPGALFGAVPDSSTGYPLPPPAFFLLVDSSNMLEFWSPRVRQFVCERGLQQYGAPPAAFAKVAAAEGALPQPASEAVVTATKGV